MSRSRYLVGIDLGTTNCAVAYVDTHGRERPSADIRNFEVPQLVAPGETAPGRCCRRSCTCRATTSCPRRDRDLPWNEGSDRIVGEFARSQGAKVPSRLGQQCQELALPCRHRPRGRHPPLGKPAGSQEGLAGRGLGGVPAAHPRRLERRVRPGRSDPSVWKTRRWC